MGILAQLTATGLVNGMIYALVAFGFIAVYRVTNVVNFAQGEFLMVGGFVALVLHQVGLPWPLVLLGGVAATALLGAVVHRVALQPAGRGASVESLVIITIGVSFLLRGVAQLIWGSDPLPVPPFTGSEPISLLGFSLAPQALWILVFGPVVAFLLWLFFTRTTLGLSLRACAENRSGADLVGIDGWRMGRVAFALGCGLAGLAGVLLTPLSFVSFGVGVLLGFKGFTAAILGGLRSFPAAAAGGLLLGLLESYSAGYLSSAYRDAVTFVVLLVVLLVRPQGFVRGGRRAQPAGETASMADVLPGAAGLRRNLPGLAAVAAAVAVMPLLLPRATLSAFVFAGLIAAVAVGVVLLLGYAGQISLGHASLLGVGGYSSAFLTMQLGWPPLLALLVGVVVACVIAWVIARIIFRFEGFYLAMATLGLTIIFTVVTTQWTSVTGGSNGIPGVRPFAIGGFAFVSTTANLYLAWALALVTVVLALQLVNSRFGRSMRAIKGSEQAAVALGVEPARVKRQVFVISAALAAAAGSLYVHFASLAHPGSFDLFQAINILVAVVVGGMQTVWGGPLGAVFMTLVPEWIQRVLPGAQAGQVEQIVFGLVLVLVMVLRPGGITGLVRDGAGWVRARLRARRPVAVAPIAVAAEPPEPPEPPDDRRPDGPPGPVLVLEGVAKSFGGLRALQPLDLAVDRGSITALIGPNGAGKTTAFNCIAGALRPDTGTVVLDGVRLDTTPEHDVVRRGLVRTFQNVQLFRDMTALENVMVGCHSWTGSGPAEAALRVGRHRREEAEIAASARRWLGFVGLAAVADRPAGTLPFGHQRMLELARALAAGPGVLLLDEPAAGLNRIEKDELVTLLRRVQALGVTLLLVEHDMTLVMDLAEHIVVLDHGAVIARGSPSEVQADASVVEAYLGAPA